ncbi:MAG TPA: glycerophosphodiester phosphodiesterase family protein [Propionibacteriaceae bacterium]|nr:glycerophosphodiester phosphodiesterase family protein [Propionibacteriaceae bacterium]
MAKGEAGRVFISYRRQETAWPARQLYDVLVAELGADRVFKDVDDIEPGDDFVERLQSAVGSCEVLLALIGPQWLTVTDANGARRLDDPEDFVRLEVETALNRDDVRVIPILVDNAKMPTPQELPAGLAALTRRQAVEINPVSFDTRRLLRVLNHTLNDIRSEPAGPSIVEAGAGVRPPGTTPPVPPVEPAPGTSVEWALPSAPAGPGSGGVVGRRRTGMLVAVATSIVLLVAVGVAVWYLTRDPGQGTATPSLGDSASSSAPSASTAPSGSPSKTTTADDPTGSDILAHRGGDEKYPLQTFESLTSASDDGFAVETDVRWTSDNHAVIIHDEAATQGLRCDRPYRVSQTTWKVLSEHCRSFTKNGKSYPPTTYANLMEGLASYDSWVYVEVKADQNAAQNKEFIDAIRSNGLSDRTVVTSNDLDRLAEIEKLAPDLPRMLFVGERVPVSQLADEKLWAVAVNHDVASKGYVTELKKAGIIVIVWTVNEERAWERARSAGADKVLTDKPKAYADWLGRQ